ncbi:Chondroitin synthase [Candidatus Brocadiaceae bacterium]|nr:Chondroitin synthase [Candidatus Brocadiaceae bacterium]
MRSSLAHLYVMTIAISRRGLVSLAGRSERRSALSSRTITTMRNHAIQAARHEVIVSIDCDIICPPRTIEEHLRWFHISEHVASIGARRFVDTSALLTQDILENINSALYLPTIRSISNTNTTSLTDKRLHEFAFIKQHPFPCNCFHGANVAYSRGDALAVGLWDETFNGNPNYEDIEFGQRLWQSGIFLVYTSGATVLHQENRVVSLQQKQFGGAINRQLLFSKIPGLQEFRARLAAGQMEALESMAQFDPQNQWIAS